MIKYTHRLVLAGLVVLFALCPTAVAAAQRSQDYIPLISPSVILAEQHTGKILYAKNERAKMYPASLTKILTALVALEYLDLDSVIIVGKEIHGLPADYNTAVHTEGEAITVRNLIRALIIHSGNETGCILAINTIRARENRESIPYADAERLFSMLMNEKARELGATDSRFNNPYGLHSEEHYTTAYDMALICRAYMDNETLRQIAGERGYEGDGLEGREIPGARVRAYNWQSHNQLLLGGSNAYPYATGIKTGFTDEAGECLAASASRRGIDLVAVVFFSKDPGRWQDAKMLFDYGFETYAYEAIQEKDAPLEIMQIGNPRLGDTGELAVIADEAAEYLLSRDELNRLQRVIVYDGDRLSPDDAGALLAPIEKDTRLGTVSYSLDGDVLFTGTVRAGADVFERNMESDMDYYADQVKKNIFTLKALPYWFGAGGLLVGVIGIAVAIAGRRGGRDRWRVNGGYDRFGRYR
jgi:D-alanyl-D-alanine carboxypeptidase (penicillin-binding protein 5/6)